MLNFIRIFECILIGTAWLSSVRVVKCNIKLFNERNLCYKFNITFLLKILYPRIMSSDASLIKCNQTFE